MKIYWWTTSIKFHISLLKTFVVQKISILQGRQICPKAFCIAAQSLTGIFFLKKIFCGKEISFLQVEFSTYRGCELCLLTLQPGFVNLLTSHCKYPLPPNASPPLARNTSEDKFLFEFCLWKVEIPVNVMIVIEQQFFKNQFGWVWIW